MTDLPPYVKNVHDVARMIPRGRVTTYGAIADFLTLGSARMAGHAMKLARGFDDIPAQRVVNASGVLTGRGHFTPPSAMQQMLEDEGVEVKNDKVVNFREIFWSPLDIPQ